MSRQPHAVVVGAGIGGLASALGLQRAGWDVRVLERRPVKAIEAEPGSGISVWPNGLRALAALGVQEPILAGAAFGGRSGVRTPSGHWIARMDFGDAIRERYGLPLIITRRARLVEVLVDALGADRIEYAAEVDDIDTVRPAAHFAGAVTQADLVVVADGARSRLRRTVLDSDPELRYAGYTSWRFIAPRPPDPVEPAETWGRRGLRFAILPLHDTHVYCYATADAPAGQHAPDEREQLRARFGNWHAPIPQLLDALPPDAVIRTDVAALVDPPTTLHRGRVALVGDAAHAMTPDLGQGACQALEDAATLAALLRPENEIEHALADYTRLRGKRTADIVRRSHRAGRLYQSPAWIRSIAARVGGLLPAALTVRSFAATIDWNPPGDPEHP